MEKKSGALAGIVKSNPGVRIQYILVYCDIVIKQIVFFFLLTSYITVSSRHQASLQYCHRPRRSTLTDDTLWQQSTSGWISEAHWVIYMNKEPVFISWGYVVCTSSLCCSTGVNRGNDNSGNATDSKVMFRNVRMLGHSSIQTGREYFKWQGAKSNACLTRAKPKKVYSIP